MTRPLRADAARNRARVLEVAYDTFAAEGLTVPIDEIARRAGVGAGTVYRHFPTKEALVVAVAEDRVRRIAERARTLLAVEGPGQALFRSAQAERRRCSTMSAMPATSRATPTAPRPAEVPVSASAAG